MANFTTVALKPHEEIKCTDKENFFEVLSSIEEQEYYKEVPCDSLSVIGRENAPLIYLGEEKRYGANYEEDVKTNLFRNTLSSTGIFVDEIGVEERGLFSLAKRCGAHCEMVMNTESSKMVDVLPNEQRGKLLALGASLHHDTVKVFVSNGMIYFVGSNAYLPLKVSKGVNLALDVCQKEFEDSFFKFGYISHDMAMVDIGVDSDLRFDFEERLKEKKVIGADSEVSFTFRMTTSNIGNYKMAARLMVSIGKVLIPISKEKGIKHIVTKENPWTKLKNEWSKVGSLIKEFEDEMEGLGNTDIKHPQGCLYHALRAVKCPTNEAMVLAKAYSPSGDVTAIDIYLSVAEYANSLPYSGRFLDALELTAGLAKSNFKTFDKVLNED
ncbi:hypothetical protein [Eubacterium oxidoreducens]|uniref:Uncharacterized protein n=1 Tax=Eubacterium oxidoreducens TaxID=1732 RepID=A0A1G6B1W5_EUBOX|nr:hypothetical protein [Eubacterium oxidoreducens]SDB14657.1 hypothetical protein SAMN02910417_01065 [Eubacterium oxidoreducens]